MTIELKIDNGVTYSLTIPRELFNLNTKAFIIETLITMVSTRWYLKI